MLSPYILFTALTVQLLYILVNWYFFRRNEYLYYSVYVVILTLYFLNRYESDANGFHHIGSFSFSKHTPDRILCILSYIFYFKFGRLFVNVNTRYLSIRWLMLFAENTLFAYIGIECVFFMMGASSVVENNLFMLVNLSIFIFLAIVFSAMIRKNEMIDRFILTGSMFFAISAFVTLWLGYNKPINYDDHMIALQIGALVEMVFLNAGLVYKSRMLQQQTMSSQKQLIERYAENNELLMRLNNIRDRISRDLHDDVGATLSSIKAYSEILKANPKNPLIADLISSNSTEMIESIEIIAWSANSTHDRFRSLKNMMQKFAVPLCHAKNIDFDISSSTVDDEMQIQGEIRQNLFLIFKEAINNMIKYAAATSCTVSISNHSDTFLMEIADNGIGYDGLVKGSGNGLLNMQKRAGEINGKLTIENNPGKGMVLKLSISYPFRIPDSWDEKNN